MWHEGLYQHSEKWEHPSVNVHRSTRCRWVAAPIVWRYVQNHMLCRRATFDPNRVQTLWGSVATVNVWCLETIAPQEKRGTGRGKGRVPEVVAGSQMLEEKPNKNNPELQLFLHSTTCLLCMYTVYVRVCVCISVIFLQGKTSWGIEKKKFIYARLIMYRER